MEQKIVAETFVNNHPFERMLDEGTCTQYQLQQWLCNRYAFQKTMVAKDAIVLEKCPLRSFRKIWIKRIYDADDDNGGLECWIKLGQACGVDVTDESRVYPATRFAMESFLHWCHSVDWKVIVASSLSQLKALENHRKKCTTWYTLYPWIEPNGLEYFLMRITQVEEDSKACLEFIKNANLPPEEIKAASKIKREIMTCLLDAVYASTVIIPQTNHIKTA